MSAANGSVLCGRSFFGESEQKAQAHSGGCRGDAVSVRDIRLPCSVPGAEDHQAHPGSDTLAVAEMNLNSFRGDVEMNDLQTDASTELYQALEEYLGKKLYLPCINQDAFDAGGQDVVLQFGSDDEAKVWLAFYADSRICLVNGKKAYVFPGGKAVYQEIEEILASVSTYTAVTVTAIDEKNDFLMAEEKNGKLYAFHKVSEKLRTKSGKQAKLEDLAVGDELTVLSDGRVLLSDPYQIENIYQIYT